MTPRPLRRVALIVIAFVFSLVGARSLQAQVHPSILTGNTCGNNPAAFGTAPIATGTSFECDFIGGALAAGQSVVFQMTSPAGTTFQTVGGAFPAGCTSNAGPTATLTVTCAAGLPGGIQRGLGLNGGPTPGTINFTANYNGAGAVAQGPFAYQFDAFAGSAAVSPFAGTAAPVSISCVNVTAPGTPLKVGQVFSCTVTYPAAQTPSFVTVTPAGGSAPFTPSGAVSSTRPGATSGYACGASNPPPGSACTTFSFAGSFTTAGAFPASFTLASYALGALGAYSSVALVPSVAFGAGGFVVAPATVSTTTTLTASPNPTLTGQVVTLTATVTAAGGGTPTGTVTFFDGATALGTAPVGAGGTATFTTTTLAAGSHSLTASYSGDAADAPSTSPAVTEVVFAAPPAGVGTGPTQAAIGCANSAANTDIAFPTLTSGSLVTSNQLTAGGPIAAGVVVPGVLSIVTPNVAVLCGAVFEDAPLAAPAVGQDIDPSTVDGGTITFNLTSVNGVAQILESNTNNFAVNCGSTAVFEGCQGGVLFTGAGLAPTCFATLTCTSISPSAGNTVHVALRPGATFSLIGGGSPVATLNAVYNRFPSITALAGANPVGQTPISTNTISIPVATPTYAMTLSPSPAIIPAASGTGTGSTLTASLFHISNLCGTLGNLGLVNVTGGFFICGVGGVPNVVIAPVAGAESGVVTFSTSSGVLGSTLASAGSGQQVYSVHCGQAPATSVTILIPTLGLNPFFSLAQCLTATATLFGGGAAGTAAIVANFVGDWTGGIAQATTTVGLSPTAATVALNPGCNEVITPASTAAGTTAASIAGQVVETVVVSLWKFDNSSHTFKAGFFSLAGAPLDFTTLAGGNQSLFLCVSGSGTFPTGAF